MRSLTGLVLTATGVLACPCHLPLTLPILLSVLGGTSLGLLLGQNAGLVFVGASLYFLAALGLGLVLLGRSTGDRRESAGCRVGPSTSGPDARVGGPPWTSAPTRSWQMVTRAGRGTGKPGESRRKS